MGRFYVYQKTKPEMSWDEAFEEDHLQIVAVLDGDQGPVARYIGQHYGDHKTYGYGLEGVADLPYARGYERIWVRGKRRNGK